VPSDNSECVIIQHVSSLVCVRLMEFCCVRKLLVHVSWLQYCFVSRNSVVAVVSLFHEGAVE
jgi:hypothetical protein